MGNYFLLLIFNISLILVRSAQLASVPSLSLSHSIRPFVSIVCLFHKCRGGGGVSVLRLQLSQLMLARVKCLWALQLDAVGPIAIELKLMSAKYCNNSKLKVSERLKERKMK